jgi:hypothetical protein
MKEVAASGVFVLLIVGMALISLGPIAAVPSNGTDPAFDTNPGCTNKCDGIAAQGGFITGYTAVVSFDRYVGENDTSGCGTCFSVQINSNFFDKGESDLQTVAWIGSTSDGRVSASINDQIWWFGSGAPPAHCKGGQWINYTGGGRYCNAGDIESTMIGTNWELNGTMAITASFYGNGTGYLSLAPENGDAVNGALTLPLQIYGNITAIYGTIVGFGGGSAATFNNGTALTLSIFPQTNTGNTYGTDWVLGGDATVTAESSNLVGTYAHTQTAEIISLNAQ